MKTFRLTLTGTRPLMVNSPAIVNPFHPLKAEMKKITSISSGKRSEEQNLELLRLTWLAGLYHDDATGPYLPSTALFESARQAAALSRQGKTIERGLTVMQMKLPIQYDGPRDPETMWNNGQGDYVDIRDAAPAGKRIIVARPIFPQWSLEADVAIDPEILDPDAFKDHLVKAGQMIGIGTYRKLFGRYDVEVAA